MEKTITKTFVQKIMKVLNIKFKLESSNYKLLSKYDVAPTQYCYNWIHVKNIKKGYIGTATKGHFETVNLWLTKKGDTNGEEYYISVSKSTFNKEYVITSITDHWGEKIA